MKKITLKICLIVLVLISCEEVFYEDDISGLIIELLSPMDAIILNEKKVMVNWGTIDGVDSYQLQIATPTFLNANQIVLDTILPQSFFEIELAPLSYQYRVRGINTAYKTNYNTNSFAIETLNLEDIVNLRTPDNALISNEPSQQLSWDSVDFASNYRLQVWTPDTSGNLVQEIMVVSNDTLVTFDEGNFIWQIRAENDEFRTTYSSRSILIDNTVPNTPQLVTPVDLEETIHRTVSFKWERALIEGSTELDSLFVFKDEILSQVTYKEKISDFSMDLELSSDTYYWYVRSYDLAGNKSEKSEIRSFTILEGISQSIVELLGPDDQLISNENVQVLSWSSVEFADSYRIQILKADGSSEIMVDVTTDQTTKEFTFQDGFFNWKIKAQNDLQETAFSTRSILIDTKIPNTPEQLIPLEGHEQVEKIIHFEFSRINIEGSMELDSLFVFSDPDLNTLVLKSDVENGNHYQEFEVGNYYWFVQAFDKAGNESEKSQVLSFSILEDFSLETVELILPEDELITNTPQQTLQWSSVEGALDYNLLIHKVDENIILSNFTIPILAKTIAFEDGYYTWKVRAQNSTQNTEYNSRNILVDTTVPNIPALQSPADQAVLNDTTVHFIWNFEAIEGSDEKSMIYIYSDSGLTNLIFSGEVSGKSMYKDLVLGSYYWYVKASDEAGNESGNSEVFSFTIE